MVGAWGPGHLPPPLNPALHLEQQTVERVKRYRVAGLCTYKAKEADTVDTRPTTAEETHDGEDKTQHHQGYWNLVDDDHRLGLVVVDEERPQSQ